MTADLSAAKLLQLWKTITLISKERGFHSLTHPHPLPLKKDLGQRDATPWIYIGVLIQYSVKCLLPFSSTRGMR